MEARVESPKKARRRLSADERFYVSEALQRRYLAHTDAAVKIGMIATIPAIILVAVFGQPKFKMFYISAHVVYALLSVLCLDISRWRRVAVRYLYPCMIALLPLCYLYVVHENISYKLENETIYAALAAFMICLFAVMVDLGLWSVQLAVAGVICAGGYWAYDKHPMSAYLFVVHSIATITGVGFMMLYRSQDRQIALREYHLLIRAAPAKIVRQAASSQVSIFDAFAPKLRRCVCISSDWRGYQELSSKISPADLAKSLGSYYESCTQLLNELFPDGNFYSDWIADELFIVIFAKDDSEEKLLVNQALRFAQQMLGKKQKFLAEFGLPKSIDIGISSGSALIGMIGPETHRKATALGDVPGVARRLQDAGKLIRHHVGDRDRVIFGVKTLMEITEGFEIHEFGLENGQKIRDLSTNKIFYMEHTAQAETHSKEAS
jgi:class 3 adenylate cyclase